MTEFFLFVLQQMQNVSQDDTVTCKYIIGGMAAALVAVSGWGVKNQVQLNNIQAEWAKYMREQVDLVRTLNDEVNKPPRGGK